MPREMPRPSATDDAGIRCYRAPLLIALVDNVNCDTLANGQSVEVWEGVDEGDARQPIMKIFTMPHSIECGVSCPLVWP